MPQFINIFELARRGETIEGEVAVKDLPNLLGFTATENGTLRFVATGLGERRGLPAVDSRYGRRRGYFLRPMPEAHVRAHCFRSSLSFGKNGSRSQCPSD